MKYRIVQLGEKFYPQYRKWGIWRRLAPHYEKLCVSDALLRIQTHHRDMIGYYDEKKPKRKIIKVIARGGWAILG